MFVCFCFFNICGHCLSCGGSKPENRMCETFSFFFSQFFFIQVQNLMDSCFENGFQVLGLLDVCL